MPKNGVNTRAQIDAENAQGDRDADATTYALLNFLSNTVKRWWNYASPTDPKKITLIRQKEGKQDDGNYAYFTYASDARKLERVIGIPPKLLELQGKQIPYIRMEIEAIHGYSNYLIHAGISLEMVWHPDWDLD